MKRVIGVIISLVMIIMGLSGQYVLVGTHSSIALVIVGAIIMVIEIVGFVLDNKEEKPSEDVQQNDIPANEKSDDVEILELAEQPTEETKNQVDYKAIHDEMYYVEYKLIPQLIELYNEQPEKAEQIIITIYENLVTLQNNLRKVNPFAFGKVSSEVLGNPYKECLVVYTFPKPLDMPLAKYGAVYFNLAQRKYQYWTLERSLNDFALGSKTSAGHVNYGPRNNMTKEEFIHEVCQVMGVEESILQPRNMICRQHVMEMNDRSFQEAITQYSHIVVCFYDFNNPSKMFIPILERVAQEYNDKIAIGIYDVYGGDEYTEATSDYNVTAMPTLLFFKDGKEVKRHIGVCSSENLRVFFDEFLNS